MLALQYALSLIKGMLKLVRVIEGAVYRSTLTWDVLTGQSRLNKVEFLCKLAMELLDVDYLPMAKPVCN